MTPRRFTTIGRALDPEYGTNRLIVALTVIAAVLAALVVMIGSGDAGRAGGQALLWGGAVFLSWALARELDPEAERAAFVAVGVAVAWVAVMPRPSLILAVALLPTLRIVNRTVGPEARPLDTLITLAVIAWATVDLAAWSVAAVGGAALVADRLLRPNGPVRHFGLGLIVLGGGVTMGFIAGWTSPVPAGTVRWVAIASAILFGFGALRLQSVHVPQDVGGDLSVRRVRAGMVLGLALALSSLLVGVPTLHEAGLLWACLAALGVAGLDRGSTDSRH